ncbi:MAG: hypothetical protein U0575_08260 [Phycisphaerales bacterium]
MSAIHGKGHCDAHPLRRTAVALAVAIQCVAWPAHAGQVEELMSFQARLTDNLGNPLSDGTHVLDFFIYDAPTGGAIIGVVLDVQVQTSGGTGIVSTSFGPIDKGWFDDAPRFLGLTIDDSDDDPAGDELTPRIRLTSVPFAFRAFNLQSSAVINVQGASFAGDVTVNGAVGIGTSTPSEQLHLQAYYDTGMRIETIGANTTPSYQMKNSAREWQMRVEGLDHNNFSIRDATAGASRLVIDKDGYVGIGTTSPCCQLQVADWGVVPHIVSSRREPWVGLEREVGYFGGWGAMANGDLDDFTAIITHQVGPDFADLAFWTSASGEGRSRRMTITSAGNVGIGTAVPTARLQVSGDLRFEGNDRNIVTNSADGADNEFLSLCGGGATSFNRGSFIRVHGNEAPGENGQIRYFLGNVAGAQHRFYTHDGVDNAVRMVIDRSGRVGIGTGNPSTTLDMSHIDSTPSSAATFWNLTYGGGLILENNISASNAVTGIGLVGGNNNNAIAALGMVQEVANSLGALTFFTGGSGLANTVPERMRISSAGNVGIGTSTPQEKLDVDGKTRTKCLSITGGCDLAERFNVSDADKTANRIQPGMVLVIDRAHPGKLCLSTKAHDIAVAGVVSGAGGINTGLTLSQDEVGDGEHALALAGRVYCWCDTTADGGNGPIEPGDRLTTSATPGHAMKVTDESRASGTVIGKAMSRLAAGRGLVLVLLQPQ